MGGQISAQTRAGENALLKRFAGLQPITDNDPFWNQLIAFNWHVDETDKQVSARFEQGAMDIYESLMYNTSTTGNVAALVRVFLRRAAELKTSIQCQDKIFLWQTSNALLILRHCAKFLTERLTETEFIRVFSKTVLSSDGEMTVKSECDDNFENSAEEFLNALIEIIVDLPYTGDAASLHMEAVKCLIVLLSRQLHRERAFTSSRILHYLMAGKCSIHAPLLAKILLHNFIIHGDSSSGAVRERIDSEATRGSLVLGVASSVWSALEWGAAVVAGDDDLEKGSDDGAMCDDSFGNYCLLLVVCLGCYAPQKVQHGNEKNAIGRRNPYREALASFQNSQETSSVTGVGTHSVATFKLDYAALYSRLCTCVCREPAMLLLYMLLHSNQPYRTYVLSRVSLEQLVGPVLRVLHEGQKPPCEGSPSSFTGHNHHVYLALVVLLMLSEDDFYCKVVHETTLENVGWVGERPIAQISLGGLLILVLVRTVQINIVKMRDRYLHTNALATLSNMAPYWRRVPATACQRLVGLLELLSRRYVRQLVLLHAAIETGADERNERVLQADVSAFEEAIRTLLEILNRCLAAELRHNAPLVYAMLHKRAVFDLLVDHAVFQDLVANLLMVLNHFGNRVSALEKGSSAQEIMDVIEKGALQWPTDRLKKFPDMTFRYVEDEHTEDFFVPYVWRLIHAHTALYWDSIRIKLFRTSHAEKATAPAKWEDAVLKDNERAGIRQQSIGEDEVTRILEEEMKSVTVKGQKLVKEEII